MTSKHCFFKIMKEDFRHKLWMLALSILGNMLAIPVTFLLATGDTYGYYSEDIFTGDIFAKTRQVSAMHEYFASYMLVFAAVVAVAGALIVGLAGFRYLFHKNMVDTYHSIPVKRKTLFAATWLNGFLIWFVPFVVMFVLTTVLGEIRLGTLREELTAIPNLSQILQKEGSEEILELLPAGGIALKALRNGAALVIIFLLVYNLCLVAVMLCGNILNTLVLAAIMGVGAVAIYGIGTVFCMYYFRTYIESIYLAFPKLVYASPLVSVIYFLVQCGLYASGESVSLFAPFLVNGLVALGLLAAAFVLYLRRPSELSEQGMKCRPVRFASQALVTLGATMGGWLVFTFIAEETANSKVAWGIFGALLAGIIVFGVMDIVTGMEFKAFFRHKIFMAVMMAAGLLICFAFQGDWFGFDSYLPKENQIQEIAVYSYELDSLNRYDEGFGDKEHPIQRMHIKDSEAAYEFLKTATEQPEKESMENNGKVWAETVYAKVTLKSGRSYYRRYNVYNTDCDALYRLVCSKEYLDAQYRISEAEMEQMVTLRVGRSEITRRMENPALAKAVCNAYNQDLEEMPDAIIRGEGRLFCTISMNRRSLKVYEGMTHTREALREYGLEEYADPMDPDGITEITLNLNWYSAERVDAEQVIQKARETYRSARAKEDTAGAESIPCATAEEILYETDMYYAEDYKVVPETETEKYHRVSLKITSPEEIRELLSLLSYGYDNRNIFQKETVSGVQIVTDELDENGEPVRYDAFLYIDSLPEKYILRFGEQWKEAAEK